MLNDSLLDLAEANIDPVLLDLVWHDLELEPHCKEAWRPALDRSLR